MPAHWTIEQQQQRKALDGYSAICPRCMTRHGEKITGVRDLDMSVCPKCVAMQNLLHKERGMRVVGKTIYRGLDHDF